MVVLSVVLGRYRHRGRTVAGFSVPRVDHRDLLRAQLFALGIIGEYLGRMHFRMMERPAYIVRAATLVRTAAPSEQA